MEHAIQSSPCMSKVFGMAVSFVYLIIFTKIVLFEEKYVY